MEKELPIVIIEDDEEDREIIGDILKELRVGNGIITFSRCEDALQYIRDCKTDPFIIICDINIPGMKGIELKQMLDSNPKLRIRSIPFIFLSTAAGDDLVGEAYSNLVIQGFFQKPTKYNELKHILEIVVEYWRLSKRPIS